MYLLYRRIGLWCVHCSCLTEGIICISGMPYTCTHDRSGAVFIFFGITHFVQQPPPVAWNVFRCVQTRYVISCAIRICVVGMHASYERVPWTGQVRVTVENAVCRLYSGLEGCPWLEIWSMLTRAEVGDSSSSFRVKSLHCLIPLRSLYIGHRIVIWIAVFEFIYVLSGSLLRFKFFFID